MITAFYTFLSVLQLDLAIILIYVVCQGGGLCRWDEGYLHVKGSLDARKTLLENGFHSNCVNTSLIQKVCVNVCVACGKGHRDHFLKRVNFSSHISNACVLPCLVFFGFQ